MRRPPSPFYGSRNLDVVNSNSQHDHAGKHQKNKSLICHLKAAVRNIVAVFSVCRSKSKDDDDDDDDVKGMAYGYKNSNPINSNSSEFSSGSNFRGTSPCRTPRSSDSSKQKLGEVYGSVNFSLEDIRKATKNFSEENIIGDGGFGTVFKGQLRGGTPVAVKRARKELFSKSALKEFKSEILALSKIEHLNLVKFYGYLEHPDEKIIVLEYVGGGSLFQLIHGKTGFGIELGERIDIAIDVAHAVTYLHTYNDPPIIHRDIKASNVLITEKLRAKVADFGLARLVSGGPDVTHISTQIKGTIGYIDPEYMTTYQLTEKSDVYSFGVLLVELVTGRHPLELQRSVKERMTVTWAMNKLRQGLPVLVMDRRLQRSPASIKAVEKILEIAQECTGPVRQSRPSMKQCVEALWAIRKEFKGSAHLGNFNSTRSVDLLEQEAKKKRLHSLGIQGDTYAYMSA